jgi:hypothetical protein
LVFKNGIESPLFAVEDFKLTDIVTVTLLNLPVTKVTACAHPEFI